MDLTNTRLVQRCATIKLESPQGGEVIANRHEILYPDGTRREDTPTAHFYRDHKIVESLHSEGSGTILVDNGTGQPLIEVPDLSVPKLEAEEPAQEPATEPEAEPDPEPENTQEEPASEPEEPEDTEPQDTTETPAAEEVVEKTAKVFETPEDVDLALKRANTKGDIVEMLKEQFPESTITEDQYTRVELVKRAAVMMKTKVPPPPEKPTSE